MIDYYLILLPGTKKSCEMQVMTEKYLTNKIHYNKLIITTNRDLHNQKKRFKFLNLPCFIEENVNIKTQRKRRKIFYELEELKKELIMIAKRILEEKKQQMKRAPGIKIKIERIPGEDDNVIGGPIEGRDAISEMRTRNSDKDFYKV